MSNTYQDRYEDDTRKMDNESSRMDCLTVSLLIGSAIALVAAFVFFL